MIKAISSRALEVMRQLELKDTNAGLLYNGYHGDFVI